MTAMEKDAWLIKLLGNYNDPDYEPVVDNEYARQISSIGLLHECQQTFSSFICRLFARKFRMSANNRVKGFTKTSKIWSANIKEGGTRTCYYCWMLTRDRP